MKVKVELIGNEEWIKRFLNDLGTARRELKTTSGGGGGGGGHGGSEAVSSSVSWHVTVEDDEPPLTPSEIRRLRKQLQA